MYIGMCLGQKLIPKYNVKNSLKQNLKYICMYHQFSRFEHKHINNILPPPTPNLLNTLQISLKHSPPQTILI